MNFCSTITFDRESNEVVRDFFIPSILAIFLSKLYKILHFGLGYSEFQKKHQHDLCSGYKKELIK